MNQTNEKTEISVVVPVYNEEENVALLQDRICKVLDDLGKPYEVILVDDGSTDRTFEILEELHQAHPQLKIIKFRGNFGQSAAMAAGFEYAKGDIVVAMDGDLQNDPEDIPRMLQKLDEGYDVVAGWRKNRKDKMVMRKIPSKIANKLICSVTEVDLHDTGCSLKAFRKEIIKRVKLYGELHRFIPALAKIEGARITELVVKHHARKFGVSKYNITRTFRVIMDLTTLNLFIKHLKKPIHFFGIIGVFCLFAAAIFGAGMLCMLFENANATLDELNVLLTLVFLFTGSGFGFLAIGLLANLVVETGDRKQIYLSESK
ncbi:glycosyltransferase family 2 protein [candidate division KSB1 bacterium]|nr:glycosyltransferase family 2 protein [candidate division KSB1 bacterium]